MYKLLVTELAEQDLDSIISYIALQLANPSAAGRFLDAVENCYASLRITPLMFEKSRDARLADEDFRRAVIGHYIMLYKVDEPLKTVVIYRFFYGPSDYARLI